MARLCGTEANINGHQKRQNKYQKRAENLMSQHTVGLLFARKLTLNLELHEQTMRIESYLFVFLSLSKMENENVHLL